MSFGSFDAEVGCRQMMRLVFVQKGMDESP